MAWLQQTLVLFPALVSPELLHSRSSVHLKQALGKIGFLTLCKLTGLNCIEIQGNLDDGETEKEKYLRAVALALIRASSLWPFGIGMPSLEPHE